MRLPKAVYAFIVYAFMQFVETAMALKDLITQRAAMTEEQIEEIVATYIGYDVHEKAIVPLPPFARLSNKQKVLVYLVALQGWPLVTEEAVPTSASPAELEKALRIPGGSLRPLLMDLKERLVIVGGGKSYAVSAGHLEAVKAEIGARKNDSADAGAAQARVRRRARARKPKSESTAKAKKAGKRERKSSKAVRFDAWIEEGFFDEPRTLNDVHAQFHKEAQIVRRTAVPWYLLRAVDAGRLKRDKMEVNGKEVWVYQRK